MIKLSEFICNLNAITWIRIEKVLNAIGLLDFCPSLNAVPRSFANLLTLFIFCFGIIITILRFGFGLGSVTNLSDDYPWGLWVAFDLLCGVALAAGGYVTTASCYLFGLKKYKFAVRPAITTAFLGYLFVLFALIYDVGQPWRLAYPFFSFAGTSSVLFEVALCVSIYLLVLFLEWSIIPVEYLMKKNSVESENNLKKQNYFIKKLYDIRLLSKWRDKIVYLTIALTILGVILSTLHQSSLGALFLIAPSKMHPLWYSEYLPFFFFVSSWFSGLSIVIIEMSLAHRYYENKMTDEYKKIANLSAPSSISFAFARAASLILLSYFIMRIFDLSLQNNWQYLVSSYGLLYIVELLFFILVPCILFAMGAREKNLKFVQIAATISILGIILNRYIVSLIAFNWQLEPYIPSFLELFFSIFVVTCIITIYRVIASKLTLFSVE